MRALSTQLPIPSTMNRRFNVIFALVVAIVFCLATLPVLIWLFITLGKLRPLIIFVWTLLILAALSAIWDSYCAVCRRFFRRKRTVRILIEPTYTTKGKQRVTWYCSHCHDRQAYYEDISELIDPTEV